ncbi:MAG: DUF1499 domain-containing protein [bacterium]
MLDFATLKLRWRPNQYLVCPQERCAPRPHREAPVFDADADRLEAAVLAVARRQPRLELLEGDSVERAYEFVQRTKGFGFPDDISVRVWPLPDGRSTLGIYSRSRYGWSDLGVNRRRVERWLSALRRELDPKRRRG